MVSEKEIETPTIIEKGLLDELFPLKGGGIAHLKLTFVLTAEEHKRIQAMREAALNKKQYKGFRHIKLGSLQVISNDKENKDLNTEDNQSKLNPTKRTIRMEETKSIEANVGVQLSNSKSLDTEQLDDAVRRDEALKRSVDSSDCQPPEDSYKHTAPSPFSFNIEQAADKEPKHGEAETERESLHDMHSGSSAISSPLFEITTADILRSHDAKNSYSGSLQEEKNKGFSTSHEVVTAISSLSKYPLDTSAIPLPKGAKNGDRQKNIVEARDIIENKDSFPARATSNGDAEIAIAETDFQKQRGHGLSNLPEQTASSPLHYCTDNKVPSIDDISAFSANAKQDCKWKDQQQVEVQPELDGDLPNKCHLLNSYESLNSCLPGQDYRYTVAAAAITQKNEGECSDNHSVVPAENVGVEKREVNNTGEANSTSQASVVKDSVTRSTMQPCDNISLNESFHVGSNVECLLQSGLDDQELKAKRRNPVDAPVPLVREECLSAHSPPNGLIKAFSPKIANINSPPLSKEKKGNQKYVSPKDIVAPSNKPETRSRQVDQLIKSQSYCTGAVTKEAANSGLQTTKRDIDTQNNVKAKVLAFESGLSNENMRNIFESNVKTKIMVFENSLFQEPTKQRSSQRNSNHARPAQITVTDASGNQRQGKIDVFKVTASSSVSNVKQSIELGMGNIKDKKGLKGIRVSEKDQRQNDNFTEKEGTVPMASKQYSKVVDRCNTGDNTSVQYLQVKDTNLSEQVISSHKRTQEVSTIKSIEPEKIKMNELKGNWDDQATVLNSMKSRNDMYTKQRLCKTIATDTMLTENVSELKKDLDGAMKRICNAEVLGKKTVGSSGIESNNSNYTVEERPTDPCELEIRKDACMGDGNSIIKPNVQGKGNEGNDDEIPMDSTKQAMSPINNGEQVTIEPALSEKNIENISTNGKKSGAIIRQGLATIAMLTIGVVVFLKRGERTIRHARIIQYDA
eukprot:TRINITY_DN712_c0_g1_i1.p1 TRINITY_DN712_c0_g1~~TRINITY_DN712_c0_g1_i1.p1  ORF type:complete len:970 (-),score=257.74 TRINITY_DN712_c0_g1_i1:300-3209(-)